MELEDLKSIWKNGEPFTPKGKDEIAAMLKGNSQSIVAKLKRSVWFELIFTAAAGTALLIYALTLPAGALKWTSISILVLLVAYSFYYVKKLILLHTFTKSAPDNLKSNLENLHQNFSSYLKFYKRSYAVLYPVYFCLGLIFGGIERGASEFFDALTRPRTIVVLSLVAVLFFFCSTWLTNWYLKKLYGNQMDKLQKLLHELHS